MVARDLNSMVSDSRNRSTSARCSDAVHGEQRNEKARNGSVNESEGRWRARERGVVDLATPPTAEHAATLLDGHARLREASAFITGTVQHREKHGGGRMAYDRWGPRVRNFLI